MVKVPLDNFNACDDFFVLAIKCHILSAAMKMMSMDNPEAQPAETCIADPVNVWMLSKGERRKLLQIVATSIAEKFVDTNFHSYEDPAHTDKVNLHARHLLALGCFYLEFSDAIREGDGDRVLRCWRYMLPMFISSGRKNYAIEALNLLVQHDFSLPPRQAAELIWGRFINTTGLPGRNIPNDLHMEHLNRSVKTAIQNLGPNKTEAGITKVEKILRVLVPLLHKFDLENGVSKVSGHHSKPGEDKDIRIILENLSSSFDVIPNREYRSFHNPTDPLHARSSQDIEKWVVGHIKKKK